MPKGMGYKTGGKAEPRKGTLPGQGEVNGVDVGLMGAGMGNNYDGPNMTGTFGKNSASPGGVGSSGSTSTSKATGMKGGY